MHCSPRLQPALPQALTWVNTHFSGVFWAVVGVPGKQDKPESSSGHRTASWAVPSSALYTGHTLFSDQIHRGKNKPWGKHKWSCDRPDWGKNQRSPSLLAQDKQELLTITEAALTCLPFRSKRAHTFCSLMFTHLSKRIFLASDSTDCNVS